MTKTETHSHKPFDRNSSVAKLLFLAVISVGLCSFGPLTVFAPVPLIIAFLLYGRLITFFLGGISTGILWLVSLKVQTLPLIVGGMYLVAFLYALLVAEVVLRNIHPVKGLTFTGFILIALLGIGLVSFNYTNPTVLKTEIDHSVKKMLGDLKARALKAGPQSGEEARKFEEFVNNPEALSTQIYQSIPSFLFVGAFLGLWISLYVTLRNTVIWRYKVFYKYTLNDLLQFKAPDYFVWPLIAGLVLVVTNDYKLVQNAEVIGMNILYCLGVFYLFQGFGVYNDFLKYLRITGFIKSMFIVFTLFTGYKFLALIGLFDMWFNFRKFFTNKKKDEGDIL